MRYGATSDEILHAIQAVMKSLFDLDASKVHPGARLIEDLDLDSIDAIDLAAEIEEATGRVFEEANLRKLRTIQDVIAVIQAVVAEAPEGGAQGEHVVSRLGTSPKERVPA